jgi:hypothetical protein
VQHSEIAERAFAAIRNAAPHLSVGDKPTWARADDIAVTFPRQTGLAFDVCCYLSDDILNLTAHNFWGEWFPCNHSDVERRFVESVTSLLRGEWRLVEARRGDRVIWTKLERPEGTKWRTVYSHRTLNLWPFPSKTISVLSSAGAT